MPAKGTFKKYEEKMIDLYYPKYEFEDTINLEEPLKQHGMIAAFGENSDFSNITNDAHLHMGTCNAIKLSQILP